MLLRRSAHEQREARIDVAGGRVRLLFEKLYLTCDEDEEQEKEQSRVRRRSAPAKRVMRRRLAA
jgi:hypothetical protein